MTKAQLNIDLPGINSVITVPNRASLPLTGQEDALYLVKIDETNENRPSIYHFDGLEYEMIGSGGGGGGAQIYQQITRLGVVASSTAPRVYDITIEPTSTFLRAPLEVLIFQGGIQNVVKTEVGFDNSDAADFDESEYVIFDGAMNLKTNYTYQMTEDATWVESGTLLKCAINMGNFKKIDKIVIS
ncbi:hypothetical protein BTO30_13415 [Domibacillus antri]|uniref:Uncharacterized protein n=1 Tax=Domibacillus antri TaxID=1714264 RepID=A0A1Q8Q2Y2_9BACI|nr:hypothetical protein [Domibacillus antri]OLN21696.1 hypothetical protein BTO30_13415 [Domibacillus antri]